MSKRAILFAVNASHDYEGGSAVAVFDSKEAAETFAESCRAHDRKKPEVPSILESTKENDDLWDAYFKREERWRARHPAKGDADSYGVYEIPYFKKLSLDGRDAAIPLPSSGNALNDHPATPVLLST